MKSGNKVKCISDADLDDTRKGTIRLGGIYTIALVDNNVLTLTAWPLLKFSKARFELNKFDFNTRQEVIVRYLKMFKEQTNDAFTWEGLKQLLAELEREN